MVQFGPIQLRERPAPRSKGPPESTAPPNSGPETALGLTAISQTGKLRPREGVSPSPSAQGSVITVHPQLHPPHGALFSRSPCSAARPDPLHVTLTPKKLKTGIGSTVILSCAPMGSPEYTLRWYRNTEPVLPGEAIAIRGLSNETLLIASAQKSHSGAYQCFATRKAQTAQDFAVVVLEGEPAALRGRFRDSGPSGGAGPGRPPAPDGRPGAALSVPREDVPQLTLPRALGRPVAKVPSCSGGNGGFRSPW